VTAPAHTPSLAAGERADGGPRRSLILAGGGMRVAYQAGVMVALEEAGLRFEHADGTSGGTMNLAMLLSGVPPREMCERWRSLRLSGFVSPLPLRDYLRGPSLPAFGDGDGLRGSVYPHLGVDVERIRAAEGIDGTFNVCNYTAKTNEAIPHREIDLDLLVAGVSLPIFMPPLPHDGDLYLDSVWIKDANLLEAVRRGCDELWLVWCIGNTATYRNGAFKQYVHMIELSANGSLIEELQRIAELNAGRERPVRVHVIKPLWPLPLDPDFYVGRIDAAALIALGYRDARRYLARADPAGVPLDVTATRMHDPRPGAGWRTELRDGDLTLRAFAEVEDVAAFLDGVPAVAGGDATSPELGDRVLAAGGTVELAAPGRLRWRFDVAGRDIELEQDVASPAARLRMMRSLHARGVASVPAGALTVARLLRGLRRR
jgi:predicted acylesterase/phospholipase RssA